MLKAFPRPTFMARRSAKHSPQSPSKNPTIDGPILPSLGYATRGGEKHAASEDRVFTSTLASAIGASGKDITFSDMVSSGPEEMLPEEVLVAAVFDGHGGSRCVDYIAGNLCDRVGKCMAKDKIRFEDLESAIVDGFKACDDDYIKTAVADGDNSGCCALIAFVYQTKLMVGWTGDCRAVLYDGHKAQALTTDHRASEPNEKKRITDLGGIILNNRLNGVLSPSRCFGDVDVRKNTPEGVLVSEPSVQVFENLDAYALTHRTSFLILATDGVWDVLSNDTACEIVARSLKVSNHNAEAAALRLVDEASRLTSDDVTVCIITWSAIPWDVYSGGIARESYMSDEGEKQ